MTGERIFGAIVIGSFIILILTIGIVAYFSTTLYPIAMNIIDIQSELEPIEPYDIAKLESITEMNEDHWVVVVKYIDVDTNITVYEELIYDLHSKSFKNPDGVV